MPGPEDSRVSDFLLLNSKRVENSRKTPKHVRTLQQVVDVTLIAYARSLQEQQDEFDRVLDLVSRIMYYTQRLENPIDRDALLQALNEAGLEIRVSNSNDNLNE